MKFSFQTNYSLKQRLDESKRILDKYPDKIPIIVETNDKDLPTLLKTKYLAPKDLTFGQFIYVIRGKLNLPPEKALFMFVNNTIPATSDLVETVYNKQKDKDNFLYITVNSENTFG
jgi:GABA(A) receptor-associated protein